MDSIGDIIKNKVGTRAGIKEPLEESFIFEAFRRTIKDLFSDRIATKARPLYFKDSALAVACISPSLSQELRLSQGEIIREMNKILEREVIKNLRFVG